MSITDEVHSSVVHAFAGHIERKFLAVPDGASWAEAIFHVAGFDTPRRFFINAVQVYLSFTVGFMMTYVKKLKHEPSF